MHEGPAAFAVSEVKGHAIERMVPAGDVRAADMLENDRADKAAEMGRLHLSEPAIDARRAFFGARRHRYSTMLDLQKYIVAISRNVVNHDGLGSTALVLSLGTRAAS